MKMFLAIAALLASGSVASASTYSCQVTDFSDYTVEINLKSGQAAFFDNNDYSIISAFQDLESGALFKGKDSFGDDLEIYFDASEFGGGSYVQFEEENAQVKKSIQCTYVPQGKLGSGI